MIDFKKYNDKVTICYLTDEQTGEVYIGKSVCKDKKFDEEKGKIAAKLHAIINARKSDIKYVKAKIKELNRVIAEGNRLIDKYNNKIADLTKELQKM